MIAFARILDCARVGTLGIVLGGLCLSTSVWASQEPSIYSLTPREVAAGALTVKDDHGVRYVTGGIGVAERAWLAAHAAAYNTRLTFDALPAGDFVSDVQVHIQSAQGHTVLDTTTHGPKLLAELPVGTYQLTAMHDGQSIHRRLILASGDHVRLDLGFKH